MSLAAGDARGEARVEQSRRELARLRDTFENWMRRRRDADGFGQYASQLDSVEVVVEQNLGVMGDELDAAALAGSVRGLYERCLTADRQLVWVRRFWGYFSEKWDQRDDPVWGPVLAAADEVVWSCYAPAFRRLDLPVGPPPLPFFAQEFSPRAIPRRQPPQSLRPSDELLLNTLEQLPVSVVGLPEACVAGPWWLVLLAHEVGHQVAFELDGGRLPATVGDAVLEAASRGGPLQDDGDWRPWAHELFADAFAGSMVGAAHLWALSELEGGGDETLVRRVPGYPPGVVRQAVAARLLRLGGLEDGEALPTLPQPPALADLDVDDAERERVSRLLGAVDAVARVLIQEPIAGGLSLSELLPLQPREVSRSGRAGEWQRELAGASEARPQRRLEAARLATAGALAEWAETMEEPDEESRLGRTERLRVRMLEVVPDCREDGVRAAEEADCAALVELACDVAQRAKALPAEEPVWNDAAASGTAAVEAV